MNEKHESPVIVVGVDGSPSSIEALRVAERLSGPLGARVEAVTCWTYPGIYTTPEARQAVDVEAPARKMLELAVETAFGLDWPDNLTTRLIEQAPRPALLEAGNDALMLILGRRGMGGFRGLLMGSVSSVCAAHARCPVLVVRATKKGETNV